MRRMDSAELTEWIAFYQVEPWGEQMDAYRAGIIASTIANVNRPKNRKAFSPDDFIPKAKRPKKKQSVAEMRNIFKALTSGMR